MGDAWQEPVAVSSELRSGDGDMVVESPMVIRMLLSQKASDRGEVCWWETTDGGLKWKKGACLISSPDSSFNVGAIVRNAHPDGRIVASESSRAQGHLYRKLFLLGDSGPVGRPKEKAGHLGDQPNRLKASQVPAKSDKR